MQLIFRYMKTFASAICLSMFLKLIATFFELALPYILEHMIDHVVPSGNLTYVIFWGIAMIFTALLCWIFNILANRKAVNNAHHISYNVRKDLFDKTINLSGSQFDAFGLPSLTSRMTSDSYNVQSFAQAFQTICVRAPIMLVGGIIVTLTIDPVLSSILCIMVPILLVVVLFVSLTPLKIFRNIDNSGKG